MQELLAELGRHIRTARELRGLTQEKLAERAGINNSFLSQLERGFKAPSLKTLYAIATVLEVRMEQLFADEKAATQALVEREVADLLNGVPVESQKDLVDLLRVGVRLTDR